MILKGSVDESFISGCEPQTNTSLSICVGHLYFLVTIKNNIVVFIREFLIFEASHSFLPSCLQRGDKLDSGVNFGT